MDVIKFELRFDVRSNGIGAWLISIDHVGDGLFEPG
jgi:hypothetical protein